MIAPLAALILALLFTHGSQASSGRALTDRDLLANADAVFVATAGSPTPTGEIPLRVSRWLVGSAQSELVTLDLGPRLSSLPGRPNINAGDTVLVFATTGAHGGYQILGFNQGLFTRTGDQARAHLVRAPNANPIVGDGVRDWLGFVRWLANHDRSLAYNYWRARSARPDDCRMTQ